MLKLVELEDTTVTISTISADGFRGVPANSGFQRTRPSVIAADAPGRTPEESDSNGGLVRGSRDCTCSARTEVWIDNCRAVNRMGVTVTGRLARSASRRPEP